MTKNRVDNRMRLDRVTKINRRAWNQTVVATVAGWLCGCQSPRTGIAGAGLVGFTIYVSPSGNDAWSGTIPNADKAQSDGPVASIHRALEIVRSRGSTAKFKSTTRIVLRGGVYGLKKTIVLFPDDCGTAEAPLIITAYPGEKPIISGGITIKNWKARTDGLWEAVAPEAMDTVTISQLFVGGQRKDRPRLPGKNWYFMAGLVAQQELRNRAFHVEKGQIGPDWHALRDVEIVSFESWTTERQWVQSVDTKTDTVYLQNSGHEFGTFEIRQRFYIDNVREALKEPGQWYFDRPAGKILYKPDTGDRLAKFSVVIPVLRHLIEFRGSPERNAYVQHVTVKGLSLQHSACTVSRDRLANDNQSATHGWEAAIFGHGARNIRILDCDLCHCGEHGIRFMGASEGIVIQQCHIHDMGGGGVYLGLDCPISDYYKLPTAARFTAACVIDNNFIHDNGKLFPQACGVWIGHASDNRISHNVIMNLYYTGVSVGWNWATTPSPAVRNIVEFNRIYSLGNGVLSDGGGIYTLGVSPGTVLRSNWLSGLVPYNPQRMFNGLYLDEGSSHILVEDNIVQRADGMGLLLNYGAKNQVLNNLLEDTYGLQIERDTDTFGRRIPLSLIFEHNVVVVNGDNVLPKYSNAGWRFNHNVYWSFWGTAPTIHGNSFKQWQAGGQDANSFAAAPGLHIANGSIWAEAGSPANQIGFRPIQTNNIGLYGPAAWRVLPAAVEPLPIADRTPCPMPNGQAVHATFQREKFGDYPYGATTWGDGNSIAAPTEITRQKSLRFGPHAVTYTYYQPWMRRCNLLLKFSILIPEHNGTTLCAELRDWQSNPYITGPSVIFGADGSVVANGIPVGTTPLDKWMDVLIQYDFRAETSCREYQITLSLAGKELASRQIQIPAAAEFRVLTWLGFINAGKIGQECYIGYIDCG